jgi:hypothetical protein
MVYIHVCIVYNAHNTYNMYMYLMVKLSATLTTFQCHVEHILGVLYRVVHFKLYADVQQR